MFNNQTHEPCYDLANRMNMQHEDTLKALKNLATNIEKMKELLFDLRHEQVSSISAYPYNTPFYSEGYTHNSLYVGDAAALKNLKLFVEYQSVSYSLALVAGENKVNIPDGSVISFTNDDSDFPYNLTLRKYNHFNG